MPCGCLCLFTTLQDDAVFCLGAISKHSPCNSVTNALDSFCLSLVVPYELEPHISCCPCPRYADLTGLGQDQAKSLNGMLVGGGWFDKMTSGKAVRVIISPLTR
eukprot:GHUV01034934.1.p3 GENE.GHUV01034934.1~~GHUV01034934.1.p3  ORF type:complete len:104 (-),score=9.24 GHUV01034934.1:44-355(-)